MDLLIRCWGYAYTYTYIQLPQGAHPATVPGLGVEEEEEGEEFYKFKWAKLEPNWDLVRGPWAPFWLHVGDLGSHFGSMLEGLGPSWLESGVQNRSLGLSWGGLGAILAPRGTKTLQKGRREN